MTQEACEIAVKQLTHSQPFLIDLRRLRVYKNISRRNFHDDDDDDDEDCFTRANIDIVSLNRYVQKKFTLCIWSTLYMGMSFCIKRSLLAQKN